MLICPKCGYEYREGFHTCADCGEALVEISKFEEMEKQEAKQSEELKAMNPVILAENLDTLVANLLVGALEDEGIPSLTRDIGLGGYLTVTMGSSMYGKNIFVDKADFEVALEILKTVQTQDVDSAEYTQEAQYDEPDLQQEEPIEDYKYSKFFLFGRGVIKYMVIGSIAFTLLVLVLVVCQILATK